MNREPITGEGELSTNEIRRIERVRRAAMGFDSEQIIYKPDSRDSAFAKLKDALLLAAILGLVGVVWNMSLNVAKLQTAFDGLTQSVNELKAKIK